MDDALRPRVNVWLEHHGQVVLSSWRVDLLVAIDATGSISAAADLLGVPYHRAWDRLQQMEQGLGLALVERQAGGPGGGGARLTPAGHDFVTRFRVLQQGLAELIEARFAEAFGEM